MEVELLKLQSRVTKLEEAQQLYKQGTKAATQLFEDSIDLFMILVCLAIIFLM